MEEKKKNDFSKAKARTWLVAAIFAAIGVGLAVVGLIFNPYIGIFIGAITVITLLVWTPGEFKRVRRNFCRECEAKYDYANNVEWEVTDVIIKEKKLNPNATGRQVAGQRTEVVDVRCVCPDCGAEQNFTVKFQTGVVYDDGTVKKKNIETLVKKYFKI